MAITSAHTAEQLSIIEGLARQVVPDFYSAFFERTTADYLVENGHTAAALAKQMTNGDRHFLIDVDGMAVGYFSLCVADDGLLLSHFYMLPGFRGRGLGQQAMEFIDREMKMMGIRRIELFVLRTNAAAVGLYCKNGYRIVEEVLTRLGNGAVLEDYLMRKVIES